jgi:excisionase family DNA binding protein
MIVFGPGKPIEPALLRLPEAAQFLALSERTVWQMVADGRLQSVRVGRALRFDRRDLVAFIDAAKGQGAGQ